MTRSAGAVDPGQVDRLVKYAIAELSKAGMAFAAADGMAGFARVSVGRIANQARKVILTHPDTANDRFAEYIARLIEAERSSYQRATA